MIAVYRYDQILETLADSFENRYKRKDVNITGVVLARPETETTKREILPHLQFWHYRSDYFTEFFCAGYTSDPPVEDPNARPVAVVDGKSWYFSPRAFSEILEQIEGRTNWHYQSDAYLLVLNSRYDRISRQASLDFTGGLVIAIGQAVKDKAIGSASALADDIFHFAKRINEDTADPVWVLSDQLGLRVVRKTLKDWLLTLLPAHVKQGTREAIHFVARDLTPIEN